MTRREILLSGLIAGSIINFSQFIANDEILSTLRPVLQGQGILLNEPRIPYLPFTILFNFLIGWLLARAYSLLRAELPRGPVGAIQLGFIFGFLVHVPYTHLLICWSSLGWYMPTIWLSMGFGGTIISALTIEQVIRR